LLLISFSCGFPSNYGDLTHFPSLSLQKGPLVAPIHACSPSTTSQRLPPCCFPFEGGKPLAFEDPGSPASGAFRLTSPPSLNIFFFSSNHFVPPSLSPAESHPSCSSTPPPPRVFRARPAWSLLPSWSRYPAPVVMRVLSPPPYSDSEFLSAPLSVLFFRSIRSLNFCVFLPSLLTTEGLVGSSILLLQEPP